jgi:hypothetical protein
VGHRVQAQDFAWLILGKHMSIQAEPLATKVRVLSVVIDQYCCPKFDILIEPFSLF